MEFAAASWDAAADKAWPTFDTSVVPAVGSPSAAASSRSQERLITEILAQWYDGITEPEHLFSITQLGCFVNTRVQHVQKRVHRH